MDTNELIPYSLPDILTYFSFVSSLIAGIYSLLLWFKLNKQRKTDDELVTIQITCEENEFSYMLPGKIRRKNLTRAEVQGLLGILPMKNKGERYSLSYLSHGHFFRSLEEAQEKSSILKVKLSAEELGYFNIADLP